MREDSLWGAWELVSFEVERVCGEKSFPYGKDPVGQVIYSPDGHMAVIVGRRDRPKLSSGDPASSTACEKAALADAFLSYGGRYQVMGDTVVHEVSVSFLPNWVGTSLSRRCTIDGNRLVLTTPYFVSEGTKQRAHLIWQRTRQPSVNTVIDGSRSSAARSTDTVAAPAGSKRT
ncbi:MAG: lipocalin-like domain-containing protein [Deltaproteobacteria bacterium]|nr:lipocalin-like domain-containing protein [Deltaproteobacteria bacterium]